MLLRQSQEFGGLRRHIESGRRGLAFTILLSIAALAPAAARGDSLLAPLELPNQHPFATAHLSPFLFDAEALSEGAAEIQAGASLSNTANRHSGHYLVDAESRDLDVRWRYGLASGLELTVRQTLQWRGGGFTDHPIDEWHKFFDLPRGPRPHVPSDTFAIAGTNTDGTRFRLKQSGPYLGDPSAALKYQLLRTADSSVATAISLCAPLGAEEYSANGFDSSAAILARTARGDFELSGSAHAVYMTHPMIADVRLPHSISTGTLGLAYRLNDNLSALIQVLAHSRLARDIQRFPGYGVYIDAGLRYRIRQGILLESILRENPFPDDGTTDISAAVGVRYQLFSAASGTRNISETFAE